MVEVVEVVEAGEDWVGTQEDRMITVVAEEQTEKRP
jgi:hypothetical protein